MKPKKNDRLYEHCHPKLQIHNGVKFASQYLYLSSKDQSGEKKLHALRIQNKKVRI